MDLSQLLSVLRLNWDLPWRLIASFCAILTVAGALQGQSALSAMTGFLSWAGLDVARPLQRAENWIGEHEVVIGLVGLILFSGAFFFVGLRADGRRKNRAPATLLIGGCLALQVGWAAPVWALLVTLALWFVAFVLRVVTNMAANNPIFEIHDIEAYLRRTLFAPVVAGLYFPMAPLTWATR